MHNSFCCSYFIFLLETLQLFLQQLVDNKVDLAGDTMSGTLTVQNVGLQSISLESITVATSGLSVSRGLLPTAMLVWDETVPAWMIGDTENGTSQIATLDDIGGGGEGSSIISDLTGAENTNTIFNSDYSQRWTWDFNGSEDSALVIAESAQNPEPVDGAGIPALLELIRRVPSEESGLTSHQLRFSASGGDLFNDTYVAGSIFTRGGSNLSNVPDLCISTPQSIDNFDTPSLEISTGETLVEGISSGSIDIFTGNSINLASTSGSIVIQTGYGTSQTGNIDIVTGDSGEGDNTVIGNIYIAAGNANHEGSTGGTITIRAGVGEFPGNIDLQAASNIFSSDGLPGFITLKYASQVPGIRLAGASFSIARCTDGAGVFSFGEDFCSKNSLEPESSLEPFTSAFN